ncbi:MAG: hypothetical protein QOJ00_2553 [Actinomycetota bacterium]|jgi:hypothetical protein
MEPVHTGHHMYMRASAVRAGWACAVVAALWSVGLTSIGGAHWSGYSQVHQWVSELGERGAPDGAAVNWLGFFPAGVLVAAAVMLLARAFRFSTLATVGVLVVGFAEAVGYIGSAAAPCDLGCPATGGSLTQAVHNAVSVMNYAGVAVGAVCVAAALRGRRPWRPVRAASLVTAIVVTLSGPVMLVPAFADGRGLVQRVVEVVILTWFVVLGAVAERVVAYETASSRLTAPSTALREAARIDGSMPRPQRMPSSLRAST